MSTPPQPITAEQNPEIARLKARIEELEQYEPKILPSDWPHELRVATAKDFLKPIVLAFDAMNGDANYSVTEIRCNSEPQKTYEVTVRRKDKPTPHDLRKKAEQERDAAYAQLRELGVTLPPASQGPAEVK